MPYEFRTKRRIEFDETDMAGIAHFSNFFRYMEQAEHDFYRSLGLSVHQPVAGGYIGWPRVEAACEFRTPVRFDDELEIHLLVREKKPRSIGYCVIFRKFTDGQVEEVARGSMTVVCASKTDNDSGLSAMVMPAEFDTRIEEAPKDLLELNP